MTPVAASTEPGPSLPRGFGQTYRCLRPEQTERYDGDAVWPAIGRGAGVENDGVAEPIAELPVPGRPGGASVSR